MGKYFGTDGIRGIANSELDALLAYRVGQAAGTVLQRRNGQKRSLFLIGKDTRISSDLLESGLVAGLCSTGAEVMLLGVTPTPAVAYLTREYGADAGVVISASHNPFEYNGIKIFNSKGYKLSDELEGQIEAILDSGEQVEQPTGGMIGRVRHTEGGAAEKYIEYLCGTVDGGLDGLKVAVDCANGAAGITAGRLFGRLGAQADIKFADADGININAGCGSTHLESLSSRVRNGNFDLGIAFDGDADRCLAVDENGNEIDGDRIMAVCADALKNKGELSDNTIVATVLSNLGLHAYAHQRGMKVEQSNVGDRYVLEKMLEGGYDIGGEQSGHIIFRKYATTGDGQLTAIQFMQVLKNSGKKCSELVGEMPKFPQIMINCAVPNRFKKEMLEDGEVKGAISKAESMFSTEGRVLVRPSGTEALIRVMAEGQEEQVVALAARTVAEMIEKRAAALQK